MSVRISYIIPVYNGEKYLVQCLDSLYEQGLPEEEFEVICIDDCSSDSSVEVLKKNAAIHSNIKPIYHKHNKKTGTSCNEGLNVATGDFIWIIGQDDWIDKDCCRRLQEMANDERLDVLLFNFSQYKAGEPLAVKVFEDTPVMTGQAYVRSYFGDSFCSYLLGFEWRALFRREYLLQFGIGFQDGTIYEDTTFLFRALWYAEKVKSLTDVAYNYRVNEESITDASKRYKGALAYEFAFVAGKEVLDLSEELKGTKESEMLYQQALWYFKSFTYKVVPMSYMEKRVFYDLVRSNLASVKVMTSLCPMYVRCLANPKIGMFFALLLKPIFRMKHLSQKKEFSRGI